MRALRVDETKVTSRNAFTGIPFALESEKESENDKRTHFQYYPRILDLSVKPQTPNATCMWFSGLF